MTRGRAVVVAVLAAALGLGALMWWMQTRALYREVWTAAAGTTTLRAAAGGVAALDYVGFQGLASGSSPIRDRACFTLSDPAAAEALPPYEGATPLNAPGWFDCFDARAIGEALASGEARAWLSDAGLSRPYGIDEVMAVFPDGRAFTWTQINRCGAAAYDGRPPPAGCPAPPADLRMNYAPDAEPDEA